MRKHGLLLDDENLWWDEKFPNAKFPTDPFIIDLV
jgi:hypothetical protein